MFRIEISAKKCGLSSKPGILVFLIIGCNLLMVVILVHVQHIYTFSVFNHTTHTTMNASKYTLEYFESLVDSQTELEYENVLNIQGQYYNYDREKCI
jgi:hypothetical protein